MHIKHMYIFWSDELLELSRQNLKPLDNIYYIYQIRGWIYTYCNEKENLPSISVISGFFFLTKHGYGNNDAASQSFIILLLNRISLVDGDYRSRFITKKKKTISI